MKISIPSEPWSMEKATKYWQYLCFGLQIIALILCVGLAIAITTGHVDIKIEYFADPYNEINPTYPKNIFHTVPAHQPGANITQKEREIVYEFFIYYSGDIECMDYSEFGEFIQGSFQTDEQFALLDINKDELLEYDELVYVLSIVQTIPTSQSADMSITLQGIFGNDYSPDAEPELFAELLFEEADPEKTNIITKKAYVDYEINQEWTEYNRNNDECIDFEEFVAEFFDSQLYKIYQDMISESHDGIIDIEKIFDKIKTSRIEDVEQINLLFAPHQFDSKITRRRLVFWCLAPIALYVAGVAVYGYAKQKSKKGCIADSESVHVLNKGITEIKNLEIGDHVFDGESWTKIFYIDSIGEIRVKMNVIKFGNPMYDNSLTLTPEHLLYIEGYELPLISNDISIGDVLIGINNDTYTKYLYQMYHEIVDYNYTVYDISTVYDVPKAPTTNSGNIMVNGIQISVYSHSAEKHKQLHESGAIFRWISDNINEQLAVKFIDFYYHIVYKQLLNDQIKSILFSNSITAGLIVIAIPAVIITYFGKKLFGVSAKRMKTKLN